MPEKATIRRAQRAKRRGNAPSTQAGAFVREEIEHVRQGKHGARSTKQAIAIGLSKARRSGVRLKPPAKGRTSEATRRHSERDYERGASKQSISMPTGTSRKRSRATLHALERENKGAASHASLSRQAKTATRTRRRSMTSAGGTRSR